MPWSFSNIGLNGRILGLCGTGFHILFKKYHPSLNYINYHYFDLELFFSKHFILHISCIILPVSQDGYFIDHCCLNWPISRVVSQIKRTKIKFGYRSTFLM